MKILFFADRINLDLIKGDSILFKRMAEGLAEKNEVHALCHGHSDKISVHVPAKFWLYTRIFSFPFAAFYSKKKFFELIDKNSFDAVILKIPSVKPQGIFSFLPSLPENNFFSEIADELKKRSIKFFVFAEGITEKDSFLSSFMGCSNKTHLKLMNASSGIICLSKLQANILYSTGIKKPKLVFPAPVDTQKFSVYPSFELGLDENKINLVYVSSSADLNDFIPFLGFIESNDCMLFIVSPLKEFSSDLKKELIKRKIEKKIVLLNETENKKIAKILPLFDAGVYLKKFGFPFADASYMMKISEYLSCGLPVFVPEMNGPLEQAGKAGINFEKTKTVSKELLEGMSAEARSIAVEKLDLMKCIELLEVFLHEN